MKSSDYRRDGVLRAIIPRIEGKTVLDVGCIEHAFANRNMDRLWAHDVLRQHARHVTGIDIVADAVRRYQDLGYDVRCESAESFEHDCQYDVVFAGELIEHLSNPGLFLDRVSRHLKTDGCLIITTPNSFSVYCLGKVMLRFTNDPDVNDEHTAYYSPAVLQQLLSRHDFRITRMCYVDYPHVSPLFKHRAASWLCTMLGNKWRETMIAFATHDGAK